MRKRSDCRFTIDDCRLLRAQRQVCDGGNLQSSIVNRQSYASGVVLLEVVVAMSLFFAPAVVVLLGLQSSFQAARSLKFEAKAADLAVTLMSEIEMGLVPPEDAGPETYEEERLEGWTWEIVTEDIETSIELDEPLPLTRVVVTIEHEPTRRAYTLYRIFSSEPPTVEEEPVDDGMPDSGGFDVPGGGMDVPGGFGGGA